jgi:peptide/nickel transport system substrate-binding protein
VRTLVFKTYANNEAVMMALLKGDVDTVYTYTSMGMDTNYLTKVIDSGLSLKSVKSAGLGPTMWFNQDTEIGADKDVRIACRYAINYEEIISYLANGVGEVPNTGVWTPRGAYYKDTPQMEYNPDKAKQALDDAGWTIKGSDKYRTNASSEVLTINMFSRSSEANCVKAMQFIAEYLEAVGIKTTTSVCGPSDLAKWVKSDEYEVCVYIWTSGAMDSRYGYLTAPLLASQMMGQNIGNDETVKALVSELSGTPIVDRATIAGKIQDYWSANAPMVPTYWYSYLVPYNSDYTGLCDHSTYGIICPDTMMNLKLKD